MKIQFRRGSTIPSTETADVGEPFYDPLKRRFGIFPNVDASTIDWYPIFYSSTLYLNQGQKLSGIDSSGNYNSIVFDFSTAGKLTIHDTENDQDLATFQSTGVGLLSPTSSVDVTEGLNNRAINANLIVLDPLAPTSVSTSVSTQRSSVFQPGWLVWKSSSASGDITVALESTNTEFTNVNKYFSITTTNAPNGHGISQFYSYKAFEGKTICFGGKYLGPSGSTCKIRVYTSDALLYTTTITGTGAVEDVAAHCTIASGLTVDVFYIDYVYSPSSTTSGTTTWKAGKFFLNIGSSAKPYESFTFSECLGLLSGIFATGNIFTYSGNTGSCSYFLKGTPTDIRHGSTTNVQSATQYGIGVNVTEAVSGALNTLSFSCHYFPRTSETE